jgi:hypothetical protein
MLKEKVGIFGLSFFVLTVKEVGGYIFYSLLLNTA